MQAHSLDDVWQQLEAAARGPSGALRHLVFCTCGSDGADGRVVVLRHVDPTGAQLSCYSDARADKIAQCGEGVALVFWDPEQQLQVRLHGSAQVQRTGEQVDAHWRHVSEHARENYRARNAPGSYVTGPGDCARLTETCGRENFALIEVALARMDVLWLRDKQRLRAERREGRWETHWVQM